MRGRLPFPVAGGVAAVAVVVLAMVADLAAHQPAPTPAGRAVTSPTEGGLDTLGATAVDSGADVPWWLLALALGTVLLGVVAVLLLFRYASSPDERRQPVEPGPSDLGRGRATGRVAGSDDALAAALDQLDIGGDPREVVVACWVRIEAAAEAEGLGRRPAETATDVARRWLAAGPDRAAVDDLAALYHLARYSTHRMTEAHRTRARAALRGALAGTAVVS